MRLFYAALLCLLVSLVDVMPEGLLTLNSDLEQLLRFVTPALLIYLLAEIFIVSRKKSPATFEQKSAGNIENADKLAAENLKLQKECRMLNEEKEKLETALKESKERLEKAVGVSIPTKRDELVDAELINLLSLLQEKGRLLDFLMDDITSYQDNQVGAAARVVHQGCAAVMNEYFDIAPVHSGKEGQSISLEEGYNPEQYRLIGSVKDGAAPKGTLMHHGWIAEKVKLPRIVQSADNSCRHNVIAPAEIEIK